MSMVIVIEIVVGIVILAAAVRFAVRDTRQRRDANGGQRFESEGTAEVSTEDTADVSAREETHEVPAADTTEVPARDAAKVAVPDDSAKTAHRSEQDAAQSTEVADRA